MSDRDARIQELLAWKKMDLRAKLTELLAERNDLGEYKKAAEALGVKDIYTKDMQALKRDIGIKAVAAQAVEIMANLIVGLEMPEDKKAARGGRKAAVEPEPSPAAEPTSTVAAPVQSASRRGRPPAQRDPDSAPGNASIAIEDLAKTINGIADVVEKIAAEVKVLRVEIAAGVANAAEVTDRLDLIERGVAHAIGTITGEAVEDLSFLDAG